VADSGNSLKWSVGIITAPREKGFYLDRTIQSLENAGWDKINVFAEPNSPIPESFKGDVIRRRKPYGDWTNWATGLYELFLSEPDTDYFLMCEDDVVFAHRAKAYVEHALPQLKDFASLSLYTPSRYHKPLRNRVFHNECRGKDTWSTVTVIMSHHSVLRFFSDPDVQRHRFFDIFEVGKGYWNNKASYGIGRTSTTDCVGNTIKDAVIGQWADKLKLPVYYHTPALAEHIGNYSTLTEDDATPLNGRMSADFVGENFDASTWIGQQFFVKRALDTLLA
jgi:hypothetical protein